MLDHISLGVSDVTRAKAFYTAALAPLGYAVMMEHDGAVGYGKEFPAFWIGEPKTPERPVTAGPGFHLAFSAPDRKAVDAFFEAALAAGAHDDGKPGLRPHYHPDYYAAFVIDPDGNRIEAVCHKPA